MEVVRVCRCCLLQGYHKDLNISYIFNNKKEIYSVMLLECFNIVMMPSKNTAICDKCISVLKTAVEFKMKVLLAEQELLRHGKEFNNTNELDIKLEPKKESDFSESDDNFLPDTESEIRNSNTEQIKTATEVVKKKVAPKISRLKKLRELKTKDSPDNNMRNILAKQNPSLDSCDITIKRKVTRKLTSKVQEPTLTCSEKFKLRENLINILRYSNAMPFKNKSLLGFTCAYCDDAYPDPSNLRTHVDIDHKIDRLKIKFKKPLTEFNPKLDINALKCTLCDKEIENLNILKDHLTNTHDKLFHKDVKDIMLQFKLKNGEVYDCAMCSSTYDTFRSLTQHMNVHYGNYSCSKCESAFATERALASHLNIHEKGAYKCDCCEKVFSSERNKQYHHNMIHLGKRRLLNCPYCNESFHGYYQRNKHLFKIHNKGYQYKCKVCSREFVSKTLLMDHTKSNHMMERNTQCTECGYRFFGKRALKRHMVKHTGEKNYSCDVCHKSYARKHTLRDHIRIHNNDRRFKCEVCSLTFVQKCSLQGHLLSNHNISLTASEITIDVAT